MPLTYNTRFCGAKARQNDHKPCMQPAMKEKKRCRLHGGKSTGAKTPKGKLKAAQANLKDGLYTNSAIAEKMFMRHILKWRADLDKA